MGCAPSEKGIEVRTEGCLTADWSFSFKLVLGGCSCRGLHFQIMRGKIQNTGKCFLHISFWGKRGIILIRGSYKSFTVQISTVYFSLNYINNKQTRRYCLESTKINNLIREDIGSFLFHRYERVNHPEIIFFVFCLIM
jgi:hypothetical protein